MHVSSAGSRPRDELYSEISGGMVMGIKELKWEGKGYFGFKRINSLSKHGCLLFHKKKNDRYNASTFISICVKKIEDRLWFIKF